MTSIKKYDNNFKRQNKLFSFTNSIYVESTCKEATVLGHQVSTVVQNMDLHMALGLVGQHCSWYKENVTPGHYFIIWRPDCPSVTDLKAVNQLRAAYMCSSVFPTVGMAPTDLITWPIT